MGTLKVFFSCSGVGILNRGIESFFREAFDGLRGLEGTNIKLLKGAGERSADEYVLWNLSRTGRLAPVIGKIFQRDGYIIEQLLTFPSMLAAIRRERPDIIFYSDSNLGFQLFRWRRQIGIPFRLLFSNGGPCHPPFIRRDYVHQVAPYYYDEAIAAGEAPERQRMVPYGVDVPGGAPDRNANKGRALRQNLGLPVGRALILSVGWISAGHKRMDYVVKEVARLRSDFRCRKTDVSPYLVMLGAMDRNSEPIVALARERLGEANFTARSVRYEDVADYYRAADLFVLASLQEGFGRVFLEALIHGLPVIAHDHPVMRFVLGKEGTFGDLSKPGILAELMAEQLAREAGSADAARRRESVRRRFSWEVLAPQYRDMFFDCYEKVQPF